MLHILTFLALFSASFAGTLDFSDCSGNNAGVGKILEVHCDQLGDNADIVLKKGRTYTFGIRFIAGSASEGLVPKIFGIVEGTKVEWKGVNQDSCSDLSGNGCPLVAGNEYHYKASIPILRSYPAVSLRFQWSLTSTNGSGSEGENQVCFEMPAKIAN